MTEKIPDSLTYSSYLGIDRLLDLQNVQSSPAEHDETLFIIIHQVYELWFKQILHEVGASIEALKKQEPMRFLRYLKRINVIQDTLINQVGVLETMTPTEFNRFRERLNPASGFQSLQFRLLEYRLGAKYPEYLKFQRGEPKKETLLKTALDSPSMYDYFLQFLATRGFKVPEQVLKRDFSQLYEANEDVRKIFTDIYDNSQKHYDLFMVLEGMLDLDQKFILWRFRHVSMVERMIGGLRGTGGSTGVKYLSSTLSKRFFPEIWQVRNAMY